VILVLDLADFVLGNGLRLAEFSKRLRSEDAANFKHNTKQIGRQAGRVRLQICNLATLIAEARRLSATHTLREGNRASDILHVAAAMVLIAQNFLTFDAKQKNPQQARGWMCPSNL